MISVNVERAIFDWRLWLQWLAATLVGLTVGGMLALPIGYGLGEAVGKVLGEPVGFVTAGVLFGVCIGGGLGVGQWLVLQSRLERAGRWIWLSIIAGAIGFSISFPVLIALNVSESESPVVSGLIAGALIGFPVGIGQWLVLREQVTRSAWWIVISGLGLMMGLAVGFPLSGEGRELISFGASGLVTGAITGVGMVWLLRQPALKG